MSETTLTASADTTVAPAAVRVPPKHRARTALMKRLADVVSLPESRVNAFERAVTADVLVEILRDADLEERMRVARRLSMLNDIPNCLVRLLLRDEVEVAQPLLSDCASLNDCDLLDCIRTATGGHRRLIAERKAVSEVVCEALVDGGETPVIEALLKNGQARFSHSAVEAVVAMTRHQPTLAPLLLKRPELRPSQAYALFWWADSAIRRAILQRFAVSREILQEAASDVFPMAAEENWEDPLTRKALQFIERRQRNRAAAERSAYASLEDAVQAAEGGLTRELAEEISHLAGLKPVTGSKILTDLSGESLAVLCKATGLPKAALRSLWKSLKRPDVTEAGETAPALEMAMQTFDMIAVDRAQTVLRYWNWALSSAMTPALLNAIREQDDSGLDEFSVPQRAAMLALAGDLSR